MARRKRPSNSQGFINTYNAGQTTGAYNSPGYWNAYQQQGSLGQNPPVQPRMPDWQEQMATTAANRNVGLANAQATYDTNAINRDFGYMKDGVTADPNNPYARASMLETLYKQSLAGNTNSAAARGNLYAGSTQNARNQIDTQHLMGVNQLQNQYADAQHGVQLNQLNTYANAGGATSDADFQALLRQLGNK
jgi:hypothetical protein